MAAPKMFDMLLLISIVTYSMVVSTTEAIWCLPQPNATDTAMQAGLDYACSHLANCGPIQPGGICFLPNTIRFHASYAYDSYWKAHGKTIDACRFGGTGAPQLASSHHLNDMECWLERKYIIENK
ncbi:hypothetical protein Ahy_A04g020740 [Arachis hypogaea]|uniref:X8 domain-containing protein n=1 Tax=Arachis hypogaea TaxID=3818 RepID=A0A445DIG1_ARAHY|nr:hypothetical protein Ahy_A04g020740 [Arachis hypogaea]